MKAANATWIMVLVLAASVALVLGLIRERRAMGGIGDCQWPTPRASTATVEPTLVGHGWWDSISDPPAWPTPRPTNTPEGTPQEE